MKKIIYIIDIILVIVIISIFVYTKTTDTKMIKTNVDIKLLTKKKFKKLAVITSDAKVDLKEVDTSSTNNDNTSITSIISNSSNTSTDDKTSSNVTTNTSNTDSNNSTNSGTDSGVSGAPVDTNTNNTSNASTTTPAVDYLESVTGNLSSYGPDCEGCSGGLASGKSFFVDGNNAFYHDDTYGNVRVLAGSKTYKFGTIIRVKGSVIGDFNAIVLDRGGVGVGHRYMFDLLFPSEALGCASSYGVTFEVLRKGW
jgi:hypothetical protein